MQSSYSKSSAASASLRDVSKEAVAKAKPKPKSGNAQQFKVKASSPACLVPRGISLPSVKMFAHLRDPADYDIPISSEKFVIRYLLFLLPPPPRFTIPFLSFLSCVVPMRNTGRSCFLLAGFNIYVAVVGAFTILGLPSEYPFISLLQKFLRQWNANQIPEISELEEALKIEDFSRAACDRRYEDTIHEMEDDIESGNDHCSAQAAFSTIASRVRAELHSHDILKAKVGGLVDKCVWCTGVCCVTCEVVSRRAYCCEKSLFSNGEPLTIEVDGKSLGEVLDLHDYRQQLFRNGKMVRPHQAFVQEVTDSAVIVSPDFFGLSQTVCSRDIAMVAGVRLNAGAEKRPCCGSSGHVEKAILGETYHRNPAVNVVEVVSWFLFFMLPPHPRCKCVFV